MGSTLHSETNDVDTIVFTRQRTSEQLFSGNTEERSNLVGIDGNTYTIVRIGTDGNFSLVVLNQTCVNHILQRVLDALLTLHLCYLVVRQRMTAPEILIVTATAENADSTEQQQSANDI